MAKVVTYIGFVCMAIWLSLYFSVSATGQRNYSLKINSIDKDSAFFKNNAAIKTSFVARTQAMEFVKQLPSILQGQGFLSASVDSAIYYDSSAVISVFAGDKYKWGAINIPDAEKFYLKQANVDDRAFSNKNLNYDEYLKLQEKLLDYFENNGYPFAKINLDSIAINNNAIEARLKIDKGFIYHVDSVRVLGPAKISKNFIHRYLSIERGEIYRKDKLEKINQLLQELPYLQQFQPWDVTMLNDAALVNLYLQPKRSNQINVLAGFLPSNDQVNGKLLFTIDANLQLENAFGGGESMGLIWQQIQPKSPRLNIQYAQPFMFNSPFGVDFLFDLYKRDSAFLNLNAQLGLQYGFSATQTAKLIIQNQRTNVLQVDTLSVKISKRLPDVADVSSLNLGIDYNVNKTDYRYNPRKGNELSLFASAGNKNIRKSTAVTQIKDPAFNYSSLYDSVKLKTFQVRANLKGAHYFKLGKLSVLKTGVNAGLYESPNKFRNELYQIGGYRLLRGFDEESIFTDRYAVFTAEYRYLLAVNSYFFTFSDVGKAVNTTNQQNHSYIGAGVGLSYEAKGGIFNISYAVGKRNDLNFDIKQSKIHLGYVSVF